MINSIEIKNLFGHKAIKLAFNDDITILTGPNGSGKTTLLNIINDISTGNYYNLHNYKFDEIKVVFGDSTEIIVGKLDDDQSDTNNLQLYQKVGRKKIAIEQEKIEEVVELIPIGIWSSVEDDIEELSQVTSRIWKDIYTSERYTRTDIIAKFGHRANTLKQFILANNLLKGLRPNACRYIGINRLIRFETIRNKYKEGERRAVNSIEHLAKDIRSRIIAETSEYMNRSQNIDSTYPTRMLKRVKSPTNVSQMVDTINELAKLRKSLQSVGLIDNLAIPKLGKTSDMNDFEIRALHLYFNDLVEKFRYLQPLEQKLRIFKDKISSKLLDDKFMEIDKDFGFRIVSKKHGNTEIPLPTLSSGEQHEIIMMYDLLFGVEDVNLYLIDEPEISLHLDWQREYLADLTDIIGAQNSLQIILATHSPAIIGNNLNKCVVV